MTLKSACNILNLELSPQINYCQTEREMLKEDAVRAFREMMMIHHPDKGGDQEKALEIIEAAKFIKKYLSEDRKRLTISEWMEKSREKRKEREKQIRQWKKENNFKTKHTQIGPIKRSGKKVIQYSLKGEKIKEWDSAKDAADFLKTDVSAINKCARGVKYYQTAANFIWKYPDEKILQYSLNGQLLKEWDDSKEAAKSLNKHFSAIRKCARGIQDSAYGFVWKYKRDTEES